MNLLFHSLRSCFAFTYCFFHFLRFRHIFCASGISCLYTTHMLLFLRKISPWLFSSFLSLLAIFAADVRRVFFLYVLSQHRWCACVVCLQSVKTVRGMSELLNCTLLFVSIEITWRMELRGWLYLLFVYLHESCQPLSFLIAPSEKKIVLHFSSCLGHSQWCMYKWKDNSFWVFTFEYSDTSSNPSPVWRQNSSEGLSNSWQSPRM